MIIFPTTNPTIRMSKLRVLSFQYNLMKKFPLKPVKWLSTKDRQFSNLMPIFEANVDEMKQVFKKMDKDDDGKVSLEELQQLLEAFENKDAIPEAKAMFHVADTNKDGFIDFNEFMDVHKKGIDMSEIRSAFWVFDQNKDGRISAEEVMVVMKRLGERCDLEECRRMVSFVDNNGDGLVDMEEFMAMMTSTMKLV